MQASSESEKNAAVLAFDEKPETYWSTKASGKHYLAVDLSRTQTITGIAYTPQKENTEGMISKGVVQVSNDGKTWKEATRFITQQMEQNQRISRNNTRTRLKWMQVSLKPLPY